MPFAYKWFFKNQIDGIRNFNIFVELELIAFYFRGQSKRSVSALCEINYKKNGSSTTVSTFDNEKNIEVEESMIEVFFEDFNEFLINHNTISDELEFRDYSFETDTRNRIFECMKSALELRKEKLKVKYIGSDMFNSKQVIELLQFMNPVVLTRVHFFLSNFDDVILSGQLESRLPSRSIISLHGSVNRDIDICKENTQLSEQADRLNPQHVRSLEVLENSLLMKIILEKIDYFDIQSLRKVSRDIRSCIDRLKPDPQIAGYYIEIGSSRCFRNRILLKNGKGRYSKLKLTINSYETSRVACVEAANQFKTHTLYHKSKMDFLSLQSFGDLFELIGDVLKSMETPLRVKKLMMIQANVNEILNILPYLDLVESIVNYYPLELKSLNLAKVSKLVQWRNALELDMRNYTIKNSIEELNIVNFQKINIKISNFSTNDVIYLKENIRNSHRFNKFEIKFENSSIDDSLYTSMPPYRRVPNNRSVWFFPMRNPNMFLHILLHELKNLIIFKRVDPDDVPEDVYTD